MPTQEVTASRNAVLTHRHHCIPSQPCWRDSRWFLVQGDSRGCVAPLNCRLDPRQSRHYAPHCTRTVWHRACRAQYGRATIQPHACGSGTQLSRQLVNDLADGRLDNAGPNGEQIVPVGDQAYDPAELPGDLATEIRQSNNVWAPAENTTGSPQGRSWFIPASSQREPVACINQ
jgi:hypothetical protein